MRKLAIKHLVYAVIAYASALTPETTLAASSINLTPAESLRIGNYGGGSYLLQDVLSVYNDGGGNIQNTLLQFDLNSIPIHSTINSAILILTATDLGYGYSQQSGQYSNIFAVTTAWDINANWVYAKNEIMWETSGGDVTSTAYSTNTEIITPTSPVPVTWDITSLVSEWTSGSLINNGLMIKGSTGNQLHFYQVDAADSSYRPQLSITYTVPEPSTSLFGGLFLLGILGQRKRSAATIQ